MGGASIMRTVHSENPVRAVRRLLPERAELARRFERSRRDGEHIARNYDELLEKYRDRWVAVRDQEVVGYGQDARALLRRLRDRGYDPQSVTLAFVTDQPEAMIL